MNFEDYKISGDKLSEDRYKIFVSKFRNVYFTSGENISWKGEKRPSWCEFKNDISVNHIDGKICEYLPQLTEFYVFFEFERAIYRSSYEEIISYFENKPPWIEEDLYIFTDEMNWCLVLTHDNQLMIAQ